MRGKIAAAGVQRTSENTARIARCGQVRSPSQVVLRATRKSGPRRLSGIETGSLSI